MSVIHYNNIANEPMSAKVISIAGQVIDINRSNQTHLHATGGGAYASSHNGSASARVSPISVHSTNSVHDDVYILTEAGEEVFIQLVNWEKAGIRKGHTIQVIWLDITADNNPNAGFATPYVVVNNRSLNTVLYNDRNLMDTVKPTTKTMTIKTAFMLLSTPAKIIFGIICAFCVMTVVLIPVVSVIYMYVMYRLLGKLPAFTNRELKPKLQPFLLPPVARQTQ